MNFDVTDLLLGVVSVLLAISTFANTKRKDNRSDGERSGIVTAELNNIKLLLTQVRDETREIRQSVRDHGERLARCEADVDNLRARIKRIEKQLDISNE